MSRRLQILAARAVARQNPLGGLQGAPQFKSIDAALTARKPPRIQPIPSGVSQPRLAPGVPSVQMDPYAGKPPWARDYLRNLDAQTASDKTYGQSVLDAVGRSLQPLTQARAAIAATPNVASAALPTVSGFGGGAVSDPKSYLTASKADLGAALAGSGAAAAQARASMGEQQALAGGQSILANLANRLLDMPAKQNQQKLAYLDQLGRWEEQRRQWAISRNDQERQRSFDRGLASQTLGLNTQKAATQAQNDQARADAAQANADERARHDRAVEQQKRDSAALKPPPGVYSANQLAHDGFTRVPKGAGGGWTKNAVTASDGSMWLKTTGSSGGGGAKPQKPGSPNVAARFFDTWWNGKAPNVMNPGDPGITGWKDLVKSGKRTVDNAIDRFFTVADRYSNLTPDQVHKIARVYFSDQQLAAWAAKRKAGGG